MDVYYAGAPFDLVIVCNGGDQTPLVVPDRFQRLNPRILDRENTGYNLGAWDWGWKNSDGYEFYLFLQDECVIKRPNWVLGFEFRMSRDPGIGLLGESFMYDRMTWSFIREAVDRDFEHPASSDIDYYLSLLTRHGIDPGPTGTHMQSLIMFTSRRILDEIGGFPLFGFTKREAIASEIAISRLIESRGYRLAMVEDIPFTLIGHSEWNPRREFRIDLRWRLGILRRRLMQGEGLSRELARFAREWRCGLRPGSTAPPNQT
jgi:hypothetical protein